MLITKQQLDEVGIQAVDVKANGDVQFVAADDRYMDVYMHNAATWGDDVAAYLDRVVLLSNLIQAK